MTDWKASLINIGKVAAAVGIGAIVASPEIQQALTGLAHFLPAPWNAVVGSAISIALLYVKSPTKPAAK